MVQRTAARWTCRRWHNTSHVGEMLDDLHWSTLEKRRTNSSLTLFYKIHNRLVDIDRVRYLSTNKSTRHSGRLSNSQQYDRQTSSSDLLKFSYFPRIIPLWNALPESTVASNTVDSFKLLIDQFITSLFLMLRSDVILFLFSETLYSTFRSYIQLLAAYMPPPCRYGHN